MEYCISAHLQKLTTCLVVRIIKYPHPLPSLRFNRSKSLLEESPINLPSPAEAAHQNPLQLVGERERGLVLELWWCGRHEFIEHGGGEASSRVQVPSAGRRARARLPSHEAPRRRLGGEHLRLPDDGRRRSQQVRALGSAW
jgi:hypothetical protein